VIKPRARRLFGGLSPGNRSEFDIYAYLIEAAVAVVQLDALVVPGPITSLLQRLSRQAIGLEFGFQPRDIGAKYDRGMYAAMLSDPTPGTTEKAFHELIDTLIPHLFDDDHMPFSPSSVVMNGFRSNTA
jgi:hypothetical protein